MNTFRPSNASRQAYMRRMVSSMQPRQNVIFGAGQLMRESTSLGAEFFRHAMMVIGVAGLVGLAVGATTECRLYYIVLNWVTSFFV